MKKFLFSFLTLAAFTANAQTVVYSENFNTATVNNPPAGWVFEDMDGDGYNFGDMYQVTNNGVPITGVSLISRSWQQVPLSPDNTATSPMIDLTSIEGAVTLEWKVQAAAASWDLENYSVYVHTSEDVYEAVLENPVFSEIYNDPANAGTLYSRSVDISSFAGQNIFVTFRHHNVYDMDWLSIDDVTVKAENLGLSAVNVAKASIYPNPVKDEFKINLSSSFEAAKTQVTITDVTGKKVKTFGAGESYNVSDLAKGVYILTISDGVNNFTQKLIKK